MISFKNHCHSHRRSCKNRERIQKTKNPREWRWSFPSKRLTTRICVCSDASTTRVQLYSEIFIATSLENESIARTSEYEHILTGEYINSPTSISRLTALSKMRWWDAFKWVSSFWSCWRTWHRQRLVQLDIFTFTQCSCTVLSRELDFRPLLSITSVYSSKVERLYFQ